MKVLVTGATGFVGREALRQLRLAKHGLRVLARHPQSPQVQQLLASAEAEVSAGNIHEPASLAAAMTGVEAVIHLVGIISEIGENTFESVHARGTENVVAAAQAAGVRRFLHMSALGTRPNAVSRYHRSKWAAEEAVRNSGLDYTIFRPSIIFGPEDSFVNLFARMSRWSPVLPVMGSGRSRFQPVAVETVAAAFVKCLGEPRPAGQVYELAGPETFSLLEILEVILEVTDRRRFILRLPLPLARAQATVMECIFPRFLGKPSPLNRDQLLMLQEDNVGVAGPAQELLGLPAMHFKQRIAEYLGGRGSCRD